MRRNRSFALRLGRGRWRATFGVLAAVLTLGSGAFPSASADAVKAPANPSADAGKSGAEQPAQLPTDPAELRALVEAQLTEAQAALAALAKRPKVAGLTPGEVEGPQQELERLVAVLKRHQSALQELDEATRERQRVEEAARTWQGFPEPPPYSIMLLDGLEDSLFTTAAKRKALESSERLLREEWPKLLAESDAANAAVRRAESAITAAATPAEAARARRSLDLARLVARTAGQKLLMTATARSVTQQRLQAVAAELGLIERQIGLARSQVRFDEEDLAKVLETVQALGQGIRHEAEQLRPDRGAVSGKAQASHGRAGLLNLIASLVELGEDIWRIRYQVFNAKTPEQRREAVKRLEKSRKEIAAWAAFAEDQFTLARADEWALANRLINEAEPSALAQQLGRDELADASRRTRLLESLKGDATHLARRVENWLAEAAAEKAQLDLAERVNLGWEDAAGAAKKLWYTEFFTTEAVVEIDGRKAVTVRGVTVGQSIGALALFLIGYRTAVTLSRPVRRYLVKRRGINADQAEVLRRWLVNLIALLLLMFALYLADIPLTAFAFLGGALAIGVGFGTQTLFRNLISGVLVLLEHKIEVGDIIEVDGITGAVTSVDLRSATVRGFDGTEALIPNSTLLEHKVINWTYSQPLRRREIRVSVAYGAPIRRVLELLTGCAERHGLVLDEPKPLATLADFGDRGLIFCLYFWLDVTAPVSGLQTMSDLRVMIEQSLVEAGIRLTTPPPQ